MKFGWKKVGQTTWKDSRGLNKISITKNNDVYLDGAYDKFSTKLNKISLPNKTRAIAFAKNYMRRYK